MIAHFNQPTLKLRAPPTRAGGQGLNLAAASRVIVFDVVEPADRYAGGLPHTARQPCLDVKIPPEGFEQCPPTASARCSWRAACWTTRTRGPVLAGGPEEPVAHPDDARTTAVDDAHAIASLPAESWLAHITETCGSYVSVVEDHDKRLEGEEEDSTHSRPRMPRMSFSRMTNKLPREPHLAICKHCGRETPGVHWHQLELYCGNPTRPPKGAHAARTRRADCGTAAGGRPPALPDAQ